MQSCIVLGCGRSGTSLVAGLFSGAGYFQGNQLIPEDPSNPTGYFEDAEINAINEALIREQLGRSGIRSMIDRWRNRRLSGGLNWLAVLSSPNGPNCRHELRRRIEQQTENAPFLFKDPRFSYTLPAWRESLPGGCRFVVVFRDPIRTAESIVKRAGERGYAERSGIVVERALEIWYSAYHSILLQNLPGHETLYVSYDSVVNGDGAKRLAQFLAASANVGFADRSVGRSRSVDDSEVQRLPKKFRAMMKVLTDAESASFQQSVADTVAR